MASPTEVHLPPNLPFPIKIASIDVNPADQVQRGTRLLTYSFVYLSPAPGARPETRFGTWDCAIEGDVSSWRVKVGDVISAAKAKQRPVILVIEPCKHGVQIGGLCGLCGKDMTDYDYTGFMDTSRASIQMTHSAFGPTVSLEEAQRIERETAEHLLRSRKLSLIVDLDQTIVHATVDPTVGEWITEGEAWEARHAKKSSPSLEEDEEDSDDDSDDTSSEDDECNPNWEALKDVKKFRLGPELFGMRSSPRGLQKGKGKEKAIDNDGCMYYIKPRPGWQEFLKNVSTKYELHVYTMGTRAYAEEVCSAIDPDSKIFGGRILSRDESGSLTQKSLQRLFPCDTSMVVIIDDRADVWEWSPNLVKVIPYDFFVGIGDINSAFLPKIEPLTTAGPPKLTGKPPDPLPPEIPTPPASAVLAPTPVSLSSIEERERDELATKEMLTQNSLALEAQFEARPLAKKQEELQVELDKLSAGGEDSATSESENAHDTTEVEKAESVKADKPPRKALLKNDDTELQRINNLLDEIHRRFFNAYDARSPDSTVKKRKLSSASRPHESPRPYDVTNIIPSMRAETLSGVHIVFSSVIPLDVKPEATEMWKIAHMFGARCYTELANNITHVVAAKEGTVKVSAALKRGGIKVVWISWFTDSIALWRRQDEGPYLLEDLLQLAGPSSSPKLDPDDWDAHPLAKPNSYELDDIDWDDVNDEVEAAMNESDDEDDAGSDRSGFKSMDPSDDEGLSTDETGSRISAPSTPTLKRKRLRSITPSEMNIRGTQNSKDNFLRSPLSKRKKLVADRSGLSRLKEAITADDLAESDSPDALNGAENGESGDLDAPDDASEEGAQGSEDGEASEEEGGDGDGDDVEDDFLARELGEDWG